MRVEVLIRVVLDPDEDVPVEHDALHVRRAHTVLAKPGDDPMAYLATDLEAMLDEVIGETRERLAGIADYLAE